jgi:hypothetical protein
VTDDRDRCDAAGVPDDVGFATKVSLGRRMLARDPHDQLPPALVDMAPPTPNTRPDQPLRQTRQPHR